MANTEYEELWLGNFPSSTPHDEFHLFFKDLGVDLVDHEIKNKPDGNSFAFVLVPKNQAEGAQQKARGKKLGDKRVNLKPSQRPEAKQLKASDVPRNPLASVSTKLTVVETQPAPAQPSKDDSAKNQPSVSVEGADTSKPKGLEVIITRPEKMNADGLFPLGVETRKEDKGLSVQFSIFSSEIIKVLNLRGKELDQEKLRTNHFGSAQLLLHPETDKTLVRLVLIFEEGTRKEIFLSQLKPQIYSR